MKPLLGFLLLLLTNTNYGQPSKEKEDALQKIRKQLNDRKALFPGKNPVYLINEMIYTSLKDIDTSAIMFIKTIQTEEAVKRYGDDAKNGILEIIISRKASVHGPVSFINDKNSAAPNEEQTIPIIEKGVDGIYINPEEEATIENWSKFLEKNLKYPDSAFLYGIQGDVTLNFVVDTKGKVSDIKSDEKSNQKNNLLVDEFIRIIKLTSGKWKPAKHNGKVVKSRKTQVLRYFIPDEE